MGAVWGGACAGSASSDAAPSRGYRRREPERTLLHATVRAHWKTFLAEMEERGEAGANLPRFVAGEFERYLGCGMLANGFARVRCQACGDELLVAFSCKGRGFCPSCTSRRMHDTAAHLVNRVIPQVPEASQHAGAGGRHSRQMSRGTPLLSPVRLGPSRRGKIRRREGIGGPANGG